MAVPFVWKKVEEYSAAVSNSEDIMTRDKVVRLISWKQPKPSFVSLNTDGASKEHQQAGCGGIVRGSVFIEELWGCLGRVALCEEVGF
jgi:hypothetical protein